MLQNYRNSFLAFLSHPVAQKCTELNLGSSGGKHFLTASFQKSKTNSQSIPQKQLFIFFIFFISLLVSGHRFAECERQSKHWHSGPRFPTGHRSAVGGPAAKVIRGALDLKGCDMRRRRSKFGAKKPKK